MNHSLQSNNDSSRRAITSNIPIACVCVAILAWLLETFMAFPPQSDDFPYPLVAAVMGTSLLLLGISLSSILRNCCSCQVRRIIGIVVLIGGTSIAVAALTLFWRARVVIDGSTIVQAVRRQGDARETLVSPAMLDATVAMEDHHFYSHRGLDLEAIHRALRINFRSSRVVQGGSTITQQLAKKLFLTDDRTLMRKLLEVPLALELERQLTKKQILTLYLSIVPYGSRQVGVDMAAHFYFHKLPCDLTTSDSAILVGIAPHNPEGIPGENELDHWRSTALGRLRSAYSSGYSREAIDAARKTPINKTVYPYRIAGDRGAVDEISAGWMGVLWFSYVSDSEPRPIPDIFPRLKDQIGKFALDARKQCGVVAIDHLGVFADRMQREDANRVSAHASGRAIDIAGFRFADGSRIWVRDHNRPETAAKLVPLQALMHSCFDKVVDWKNEPLWHQGHIHLEALDRRQQLLKNRSIGADITNIGFLPSLHRRP